MTENENCELIAELMLKAAREEKYAAKLGIVCEEVGMGYARATMTVGEDMVNLFGMTHGGAVFSLMDDVFQLACNSRGLTAFALNVSATFIIGSTAGDVLSAEAKEVALTTRTGTYELKVTDCQGRLVATAQALAYRKNDKPPFLALAEVG